MKPSVLSRQLRHSTAAFLEQRRRIVGLSLVSIGSMGLITLYQTGIIKHLPEPPLPFFDADKVDASAEAYAYVMTPDAALGLTSYGVTLVLAAMGGADRWATHPWVPLALAAKAGIDALAAAKLSVDQWTRHRAFCFWCLLSAGATFATLPLSLAEAKAAWRQLRQHAPRGR